MREKLKTAVGSDANKYNRAARYLKGLQSTGLNAAEAYLTNAVPVLPPKYRPIIEMGGGALRVADANLLYRDVIMAKNQVRSGLDTGVPAETLKDARLNTYKAVGALVGVNNALTHRDDREEARGAIDTIKGRQNKEGLFQRLLARRRNDYSGRSTIEPDAQLGPDEIGLPDEMAWKIFKPTIVRRMVLNGWTPADAMKEVEGKTLAASQALDAEMKERPVLYNRAPSLHKWSISSAFATRTPGKHVSISPAVIGPFGADYDGDSMSIMVPISEQAKQESHGLLASRNLLYDKDRTLAYGLEKDVITGLFVLTKPGSDSGKTFDSEEEAIAAYRDPKQNLRMDNLVTIKGVPGKPAIGWLLFKQVVPARFLSGISVPIDGKKLEKLLTTVAETSPGDFNMISKRIAQAGFTACAASGKITSSIDELAMDKTKVFRLIDQLDKKVQDIKDQKLEPKAQNKALKDVHDLYVKDINAEVGKHLADVGHGYSTMMEARMSGKINPDQFRQMLASPLLMTDVNDNTVPAVIKSNYGGGMHPSDYVLTTPGARKGMVGKSLSTALPGFLNKVISANMSPVRVLEKDCGTTRGLELPLNDSALKNYDADLLDRHLLRDIPGTSFKRNDPITVEVLSVLRDKGVKTIWVRSPLTCQAQQAPCQMCAGRDASGMLHPIGSNIGTNYGQTIAERSTQLTLRCQRGNVRVDGEYVPFAALWDAYKDSATTVDGVETAYPKNVTVDCPFTEHTEVLSIERHRPTELVVIIELANGLRHECQLNHPIWLVRNGWEEIEARALKIGDVMSTERGDSGVVSIVTSPDQVGYVYDIKTRSKALYLSGVCAHNSFHSGGTLGSGDSLTQGFQRLQELLHAPDTIRDQGTLADVAGRITRIYTAPQGGQYVEIDGHQQYIASGRKVTVKVGDKVEIGDALSDGNFRPQELAMKKGMLHAQQYVVDEARKAYQQAGAVVRKPVLEVLVGGTMRFVKITDDGGEAEINIGDVISEQKFEMIAKRNPKVKGIPEVPGIGSKPLLSNDLMERLNFQRLEDAVREVPAMAGKSDLTGQGSPLPGLAYGVAFRPGQEAFNLKDS